MVLILIILKERALFVSGFQASALKLLLFWTFPALRSGLCVRFFKPQADCRLSAFGLRDSGQGSAAFSPVWMVEDFGGSGRL